MILVELVVPALNRSYDFQLDETAKVGTLVEEIVEMLCRRERRQLPAGGELLCLGWVEGGVLLHPNGGRLILT